MNSAVSGRALSTSAHNLLTSGDGTPALKWGSTGAYSEDAQGNPVYNWTLVDRIFDTYLQRGVKPYAQIGFMPREMSVKPEPYRHSWSPRAKYDEVFTGWAYPPRDYAKWGSWPTSGPNIASRSTAVPRSSRGTSRPGTSRISATGAGTPEEFRKLHDYAIEGVRKALPTARVGGADSAGSGGKFTRDFLEHCLRGTNHATGRVGTPLDFISFHAKGSPGFVNGHVRMGIANQLRTIDEGFSIVASFPELKGKPIVIGESDPDGWRHARGRNWGIATARCIPATRPPVSPANMTWPRSTG